MATNISKKDMSNVYSTEEVKIGTWIDGKPIYRKVFQKTSGDAFTIDIPVNNIVNTHAFVVHSNKFLSLPYYYGSNDNWHYFIDGGSNTVYIRGAGDVRTNITKLIIVIEYTKATD